MAARDERPGGIGLMVATGLFSLVIGLLLRSTVGGEDRTDWNGAVRGFLEVFPLLLMAGGAVVLIVAVTGLGRRGRASEVPERAQQPDSTTERAPAASPVSDGQREPSKAPSASRPSSGRAYAAEQRAALAKLRAARKNESGDQ